MGTLLQDLHYGLRMLAKNPGFTTVAVVTLVLGIGANTAMFSIVDAVLLRPLPYKNAERLTVIWQSDSEHHKTGEWFDTYRQFEEWNRHSHSFEKLAALTWATAGSTVLWRGERQQILAIPTSVDLFSMLGVHAAQGRTFELQDLETPCAVVLSHGFWRDRLVGTLDLVGRSLTLNEKTCTVLGVMPKEFSFYPKETQLWTLITPDSEYAKHPWESKIGVFGLLKSGVSRASAEAELTALQKRIMSEAPPESVPHNSLPAVLDLQWEFTWLTGRNLRTSLMVLFAAVVFVLLIASVNVAGLLMGRASERQKELGIRAALGSGRLRLVRQLLTESALLSVCGGLLGTLIAVVGVRYLNAANPVNLPPGNPIAVNWQVLAFTAVLAMMTGMFLGLGPAWKASRLDLNEAMKGSTRSSSRSTFSPATGKGLVAAEVALSLVLLAGAGLMIESVARLSSAPLGFQPNRLLTASITLPSTAYPEPERRIRFYEKLILDVSTLPGVEGVALSPSFASGGHPLTIERKTASPSPLAYDVSEQAVSAGYFRVMSTPLLQGREFDRRDHEKSLPVAIVNATLVKEYFPNEDPLGRQIVLGRPGENRPWLTIVGVVGDVKSTTVFMEMGYIVEPRVYRPLRQEAVSGISIFVRTKGNPLALAPAVRRKVSDLDTNLPPPEPETMNHWLSQFLAQPRLRAILFGIFAGLALLLATIGIYGVLSQSVTRRTHEIGIRMALGAQRRDVLKLVVRQGLLLVSIGVTCGLIGAFGLTRFLASLLFGVQPTDPVTLACVAALLTGMALLASYIPARRAAQVDPMVALRYE